MKKIILPFLLFSVFLSLAGCRSAATNTPERLAKNFPTADPNAIPLCKAGDLGVSSNYYGSNNKITIGISLTNKTKSPCSLANPPQVNLAETHTAWQPEIINDQMAATPTLPGLISLSSGESVIITMIWQNYCLEPNVDGMPFLLRLSQNEVININISPASKPACQDIKAPNEIIVLPYSYPP